MYASWKSYLSLTDQGKDYSNMAFINPGIGSNSESPEGDSSTFATMTPDSSNTKRRVSILMNGNVIAGGQWAVGRIGARPAKYVKRIIMNQIF